MSTAALHKARTHLVWCLLPAAACYCCYWCSLSAAVASSVERQRPTAATLCDDATDAAAATQFTATRRQTLSLDRVATLLLELGYLSGTQHSSQGYINPYGIYQTLILISRKGVYKKSLHFTLSFKS